MDLEIKLEIDYVVLNPLNKTIDATNTTDFKSRVVDLIHQGNKNFILNLSRVEFMDSCGLGFMISIFKTLMLNNGNLVICNATLFVLNLLELTQMNKIFNIRSTEKESIDYFLDKKRAYAT